MLSSTPMLLFQHCFRFPGNQIIRKVIDGTIIPIYNEEILAEYKEVLGRDKFPFRKDDIDWIINIFHEYGLAISKTKISEETFVDKNDIVLYV